MINQLGLNHYAARCSSSGAAFPLNDATNVLGNFSTKPCYGKNFYTAQSPHGCQLIFFRFEFCSYLKKAQLLLSDKFVAIGIKLSAITMGKLPHC